MTGRAARPAGRLARYLAPLLCLTACLGQPSLPPVPLGTPTALAPLPPLPAAPTPAPTLPPSPTVLALAATPAPSPTVAPPSPTVAPIVPSAPPSPTVAPVAPTAPPSPTNVALVPTPTTRAPAATPTPNPPPPPPGTITLLATGFGSPDDVTVDPRDGTIYFGDFGNGAINRLPPGGGTPRPVATGFNEPEGIAVAADGSLVVVEQKTNRLWRVNPATGSRTLLRQLVNTTGQDGVDGIALDPASSDVLIPDSPNGRLLAMSADGRSLRILATGFTRPTGVAVLPDGDLLVAEEFGNVLDRVTRAGRVTHLSTMFQPDDVTVDAQGIAYVNSLGGTIYRVDPATGRRTTLLSGLLLPHGLAVDLQGRLVVAEATRNRIFRLAP